MEESIVWAAGSANVDGSWDGQVINGTGDNANSDTRDGSAGGAGDDANRHDQVRSPGIVTKTGEHGQIVVQVTLALPMQSLELTMDGFAESDKKVQLAMQRSDMA